MARSLLFAIMCVLLSPDVTAQQPKYAISTEKGEFAAFPDPHPLSWWTKNPLRLDVSGDLMIGFKAPDGRPLTPHDFQTEHRVVPIGKLENFKIVQLMTTIHSGPRVAAAGFAMSDVAVWKDLLVSNDDGRNYREIYALRYDGAGVVKTTIAAIYGAGRNAYLATYDPDTGNGGGCIDGYWWFDEGGVHEVDFSPLLSAIKQAIPAHATFTARCWALNREHGLLRSVVQRADAECNGCGRLGEVQAPYRIVQGVALPVEVVFRPDTP